MKAQAITGQVSGREKGQAGFTLIELLVVTAIIGILAGIAVFSIGRVRENAAKNACMTERATFETAANATSIDASLDIRSYLKTDQGIYFEASGQQSFARAAGSPLSYDCL